MGIAERKAREKWQRRNAILDAAEKVFFMKGVDHSSMDQVAGEAELSKGTLYLYFKSKEELHRGILLRAMSKLMLRVQEERSDGLSGLENVMRFVDAYENFAQDLPGYFDTILYHENADSLILSPPPEAQRSQEEANKIIDLLIQTIQQGKADGSIRTTLKSKEIAFLLWGYTSSTLQMIKRRNQVMAQYFQLPADKVLEAHRAWVKGCLEGA